MLASLLTIPFLTGCASRSTIRIEPVRCDEPVLQGDTWADVAVLAIEQREAILKCNLENGFPPKDNATDMLVTGLAPAPEQCRTVGVAVGDHDVPTGTIIKYTRHAMGGSARHCGMGTIGCSMRVGIREYVIHADGAYDWVLTHEVCHALYEEPGHTLVYSMNRMRNP